MDLDAAESAEEEELCAGHVLRSRDKPKNGSRQRYNPDKPPYPTRAAAAGGTTGTRSVPSKEPAEQVS